MSSVFTTLTKPTAVDSCVSICFRRPGEQNLVVARKNLLQIFRLEDPIRLEKASIDSDSQAGDGPKLVLLWEYTLFGTIISLAAIKPKDYNENGIEYLLVAFETAKASLLKWHQATYSIVTISIHSFEREEYVSALALASKPKLRIDPSSRVATLMFNNDHLAFMPIVQRDELALDEATTDEQQSVISNSFVLTAIQLEDDITRLIDFTYLDGYREPTIAVLYDTQSTTPELLTWKMDTCQLIVMTLDLAAGARTSIFEISQLPSDLESVTMIPEPVGGCLLIGANELVFVDPASRKVALAVNSFAKNSSDMVMRDYSRLNLRLEGSKAIPLQNGQNLDGVLIVLSDGNLALLTLNLDGRTVTSLHLRLVTDMLGGQCVKAACSCMAYLSGCRVFIGSRLGDSNLLSWTKIVRDEDDGKVLSRQKRPESDGIEQDDLEDLYGDDVTEKKLLGAETSLYDLHFRSIDRLSNHGPITGLAIGFPGRPDSAQHVQNLVDGEFLTVGGPGRAGNLTIHRRSIIPEVIGQFESSDWQNLWTVSLRMSDSTPGFDTYLMASGTSGTQLFTIEGSFVENCDTEFDSSTQSVSIGTLLSDTCVIQVSSEVLKTYDSTFKVIEVIPTHDDRAIVSASICDPFVLLLLQDKTILLYQILSTTQELRQINSTTMPKAEICAAVLYVPKAESALSLLNESTTPSKKRKRDDGDDKPASVSSDSLCFIFHRNHGLQIFALPSMRMIFSCIRCSSMPELLVSEEMRLNGSSDTKAREPPSIVEIIVVELGQGQTSPYLVLRSATGAIGIYHPFRADGQLAFKRVSSAVTPRPIVSPDVDDLMNDNMPVGSKTMTWCKRLDGLSCLFIAGETPLWLIKTYKSLPTLHHAGMMNVSDMSSFNTSDAEQAFIYCDYEGMVSICRLPDGYQYDNSLSYKRISIGRSVHSVAFVPAQQVYAVLTSEEIHYEIPDEEDETWQARPTDHHLLPTISRGALELIDNENFAIIDKYELADNEIALMLKTVSLVVATEYNKKPRTCVAVSTGIARGEDLAMRGAIYVFDVVEVVPEEDRPDARYRLKNLCREEVRAAATTLCEVDGYLLSAQGQKVVVRSFEEDERLTPVAFIDLGLAVTTAKSIRGIVLFGDIAKGIRIAGFGEEPYKMTNFGHDADGMEVMDAEFMLAGQSLYFAVSDNQDNMRILQYDPENPTTLAGSRLIRKADLHTGHTVTCMTMIVDAETPISTTTANTGVLCASRDGSLSILIPVSERTYRRLYTVQTQINSHDSLLAGLNARSYRMTTTQSMISNPARGVLDGQLLSLFANFSYNRQMQLAHKSGVGVTNVLADISSFDGFLGRF